MYTSSCSGPEAHCRTENRAWLIHTDKSRRKEQTAASGGVEKDAVREYFNSEGFRRWNKIYGTEVDEINKVGYALINFVTLKSFVFNNIASSGSCRGFHLMPSIPFCYWKL